MGQGLSARAVHLVHNTSRPSMAHQSITFLPLSVIIYSHNSHCCLVTCNYRPFPISNSALITGYYCGILVIQSTVHAALITE